MTLEEKRQHCASLLHAMQTGVSFKMQKDQSDTEPKHLRVGVNAAMVEHSALSSLLMEKGVITEEEYMDALIIQLEQEVDKYQQEIRELYGSNVITLR